MVGKTFNRYIWLLNILLREKELTFKKICLYWMDSHLADGKPLSKRTFHQHQKAIEELFGVKIVCNHSRGYRYSIDNPRLMNNDRTRRWLLNSFTLSNLIIAGHNMNGRILFEEIPYSKDYLQPVIEAMQQSKVLKLDYQPYSGGNTTFHFAPYAMKVYRQRWYVVGKKVEENTIRQIALDDRIIQIEQTNKTFSIPHSFDAEKYYAHTVGIYVDENLKPQKVRIRVYGKQVDYLRSVPLHRTQEEVLTKGGLYSDFQLKVCLTPELTTHLLAMGEGVEILEPESLREDIKKHLSESLNRYKS
jgi:hypothetical protein